MSSKLATIIKDSAIPGKYKRILEAYAAFANNDGTNIYASKEKIGKKASCSPDTIYRNTPDLIAAGILVIARSHTCNVPNCNGGSTHFTGVWGHYTTAYNILIGNLQNAETYLSAKQQKVNAAKCRKVGSANCGTTQALKETPAPASPSLGTPDSSVLTDGNEVSEEVSEEPSFASLTTAGEAAQQNQHQKPQTFFSKTKPDYSLWDRTQEQEWLAKEPVPYWSAKLGRGLDNNEVDVVSMMYLDMFPVPDGVLPNNYMDEAELVLLAELAIQYGTNYVLKVWSWNKRHKTGKMLLRSVRQLANALESGNIIMQMADHDPGRCPECKNLRRCVACGELEDCTESRSIAAQGDYLHLHCEIAYLELRASIGT